MPPNASMTTANNAFENTAPLDVPGGCLRNTSTGITIAATISRKHTPSASQRAHHLEQQCDAEKREDAQTMRSASGISSRHCV